MAPIRYSLHFEDYSEHLMSRFGKLLQMQSLVDMTLMCSSHTLRVHKAVLAASSAYFQEVLQKQNGEPLIILKMRFSVLKSLVEFMYCGKTQCLEENLDELVSAAQFLKIKGLSKVTKEGLGITNLSELPVFTPPVVINRPPQALIDLQAQDNCPKVPPLQQLAPAASTSQVNTLGRCNMDMVVRLPFNIEDNSSNLVDYGDNPRTIKPRRGRPSARRSGWEGPAGLGRAAERALLRREQDSRKAIHQLKHLQTRHMQDYMDRVTLSQAVNSICGPETSSSHYMDSDLMYLNQNVSSNVIDSSNPYTKEHTMSSDGMTNSNYRNNTTTGINNDSNNGGISSAMSQYVNALKNAGLPTDLPILFESGDGSYINVNEQVLLDMVQSNEIQYEVIEQPNIIEKVADPSEIKSIDDLSKSIERGEMLIGNKNFDSADNFKKNPTQFNPHEDAINSLNAILPDNFDSFSEQPNYVDMNSRLQENNSMENEINNDFSCIDGDMQFFTKSMSDDVKKYYEDQQLNDNRVIDEICPSNTNFNMSLLDSKNTELVENVDRQFNSLNPGDLRRSEDCYDFNLQLGQTTEDDALDCLISTAKQREQDRNTLNDNDLHNPTKENIITSQEQEELMNDLMDINEKLNMSQKATSATHEDNEKTNIGCGVDDFNVDVGLHIGDTHNITHVDAEKRSNDLSQVISSSGMQWEGITENIDNRVNEDRSLVNSMMEEAEFQESVIDLTEPTKTKTEEWSDDVNNENGDEKENEGLKGIETKTKDNIPFALGLLPLKQMQNISDDVFLKRKSSSDSDLSSNINAKSFKRKSKCKKM